MVFDLAAKGHAALVMKIIYNLNSINLSYCLTECQISHRTGKKSIVYNVLTVTITCACCTVILTCWREYSCIDGKRELFKNCYKKHNILYTKEYSIDNDVYHFNNHAIQKSDVIG